MTGNRIVGEDLQAIIKEPLDWSVFSGKTVLITGANGFLPAYMAETLLFLCNNGIAPGLKVLALVRNIEKARSRFREYLNDNHLEFIVQDVCDPVVTDCKIDFIIHAASQASPKFYGVDPVGTLAPNVIGTMNLLKLARDKNSEGFLFFSSSEVYGNMKSNTAIKEDATGYLDQMNPRSCYAESKKMGETMCVAWNKQFDIPVKIVRPFHTYGPGLSLDDGRVFADFISFILKNNDLLIKSDGSARRAYCYLRDAISGCFYILINGANGEAYNVGNPHEEYSVLELAENLVSEFSEKSLKIKIDPDFISKGYSPSSISSVLPDISKLMSLGWSPVTGVREGFRRTILSYS
jgi:UDP-glucuronate decarboxylase